MRTPSFALCYPRLQFARNDTAKPDGSLSLPYLAGALRRAGFEVAILDCAVGGDSDDLDATFYRAVELDSGMVRVGMSDERILAAVEPYDVVGITSIFTMQTTQVLEMIRLVRRNYPEKLIIAGGVNARELRHRFFMAGADLVFLSEADEAIVTLAERLERGEDWRGIPGTAWFGGMLSAGALIHDLDELPMPAWDLLPNERYWAIARPHGGEFPPGSYVKYASLMTSRGCPFTCLAGDTLVNTVEGDVPIRDLVGREKVGVYTYDATTGQVLIADAAHVWQAHERAELVRVAFDDGTHIDCTPDHRFLTFTNGNQHEEATEASCEAKDLTAGMSIRALKFYPNPYGYVIATWGRRRRCYQHRLVAEYTLDRPLRDDEAVHHVDHDRANNATSNLQVMKKDDHFVEHRPERQRRMRENNPAKNLPREHFVALGKANKGKSKSIETRLKMREAALRRHNPNHQPGAAGKSEPRLARERRPLKRTLEQRERMRQAKLGVKNPAFKHGDAAMGDYSRIRQEVNHKVVSVTPIASGPVYDLEVPATGWFFANNVLVKNCAYCHISRETEGSAAGAIGTLRVKSVERVLSEAERLKALGVDYVFVEDDSLLAKKRRVLEIFAGLKSLGLTLVDVNGVNVAHLNRKESGRLVVDRELLQAMADCGFKRLSLPFEAGTQRVLDRWASRKWRLAETDTLDIIAACREVGITPIGNYTIGYPDETLDEVKATIALARRHMEGGLHYASFFIIVPFPGTALFDHAIASGDLTVDFNPDEMNWTRSIFKEAPVKPAVLEAMRSHAWRTLNDPATVQVKTSLSPSGLRAA